VSVAVPIDRRLLVEPTTQDPLRNLCRSDPQLTSALALMLDRYERRGRWTRTITVPSTPGLDGALREALSGAAIKKISRGLLVDIARVIEALPSTGEAQSGRAADVDPLAHRLYRAIDREPRDDRTAARARCLALERTLAEALVHAQTDASRRWLNAELAALAAGSSALVEPTRDDLRLVHAVVKVIDAAIANPEPIRIQTFSARILGSSKALHPASDLFRIAGAALYDHDPETRALVSIAGEPVSIAAARRDAVEARGIYKDEVAASVLCFGPLVYRKGRERFDHVARHARLGESSRLIQHQLRDATLERPTARRVTIFENLTPYLDYVDALIERDMRAEISAGVPGKPGRHNRVGSVLRATPAEIAVCASGQASWAVVRLVELCARHALPMRFAGDLDRSGVLILRSLRKRTGARIEPLCMGVATHRRFADRGQAISAREATLLAAMLAQDSPDAPCHALLRELAETRVWIEQEAFAGDCLARVLEG